MITITEKTNFVRIFRMPKVLPEGYCFGGGFLVGFQLVDWFNPFLTNEVYGTHSKVLSVEEHEKHVKLLKDFIRAKIYFTEFPDHKFVAVTDYNESFIISKEE